MLHINYHAEMRNTKWSDTCRTPACYPVIGSISSGTWEKHCTLTWKTSRRYSVAIDWPTTWPSSVVLGDEQGILRTKRWLWSPTCSQNLVQAAIEVKNVSFSIANVKLLYDTIFSNPIPPWSGMGRFNCIFQTLYDPQDRQKGSNWDQALEFNQQYPFSKFSYLCH